MIKKLSVLLLFALVVTACGNDETEQVELTDAEQVEIFDFSEHMRIDDRFVELMATDFSHIDFFDEVIAIDWSRWEWANQTEPTEIELGVRLRGFKNGDEITVRESKLRIDGSLWWHPIFLFAFGVTLNGEIIPYGCPYAYDYLKGNADHDELGITSFFVVPDFAEGKNILEFTMFHMDYSSEDFPVEGISRKTIYVNYEPQED
jgi:hypothetical protein